jgi:ABC-type multidrug transport system ATPase subunit
VTGRAPTAVRLTGVEKRYGPHTALGPLSLEVPAGQAVAVVGHNGSGKSTLLGLVAGVVEPTGGGVLVHGHPPGSLEARARLSYLPDEPVLYDDLSVREHLHYVARMHGRRGADPSHEQLLARLGLADRADMLPGALSRGLRQRAAIAVGLCRPFRVLVADEPFAGLDRSGCAALAELFDEAGRDGATLVVASHEPELLAGFDRCLVLGEGSVVYDGHPSGLGSFDL